MERVSRDPCKTCGGPVRIIERRDPRPAVREMMEYRTCPNPNCRINSSNRRLSDSV